MKHYVKWRQCKWVSVFVLALLAGCSRNNVEVDDHVKGNSIVIDLNDKKQTIRNFGASDAWACQYVGLWPDEKRNQVADWLFSMEEDQDGKPKGIGLSFWRFNIGAGSAPQNNIADEWRATEGFLNDDMTYDWSKQSGQKWFMQAAKQRGVDHLLGFTNSPPVQLTRNGKAYAGNGEEANISPENYPAFAKFMIEVSKQFDQEGIPFDYLSPFNEPQWDWTGNGQEGSPFKNTEIFAITKILDSLLTKENMDIKIQIAEAGKLNYLYEKADKPTRGNQVYEFFNEQSPLYMGSFSHVDKIISGHSYFTSAPAETMKAVRQKVAEALQQTSVPLEFWQSEYCVLGGQEEIKPEGKDTGINTALYVARTIHHDLVVANAAAWQWWLAVSAYDYKDGLVYVDKNKTDGQIEDSKLLWALGNFSRFIRPGARRIAVASDNMNVNNVNGMMISSYLDAENKNVITVIINAGNADSSITLYTSGDEIKSWKPYLTGSGEDEKLKPLPEIGGEEKVIIPKRSIMTLVGEL